MSNVLIAFLVTLGASAWIFTKFQKQSGHNTRQSLIGTAIIGVLIFIVMLFIANLIPTGSK